MATTLNVIKTITIRGSAEGVAEVERQIESLTTSIEGVTVASAKQEKATLSVEAAYRKLQTRYDQEFRAQQQLAQVAKTLERAKAQGLVTDQRASDLMQEAIRFHNRSVDAIDRTSKKTDQWQSSTKNARYELINLSRQIQDVGVGLASGQGLFTVAIQQGTQIADVFSTASASGRNLGRELLALVTPMRLLVVGIAAAAAAALVLANNWSRTEQQFLGLSERLDTPIEKLRTLQQTAAVQGIDLGDFVKGMEGFGDQVDRAKMGLGDLAELFRRNGQNAGDLEQSLLNVSDLVRNAATGAQRFRVLQEAGLPPTQEMVRWLRQGRESLQLQIEDARRYNDQSDVMAKKAREFNEAWSKAWDNFARNARNAFVTAAEGIGTLIGKAIEFGEKAVVGVQQFTRGETEEQVRLRLARQTISAGGGIRLNAEEAAKFYDNIRLAGEATTKLNQDTKELLGLEQRRVQILGNLASIEEIVAVKRKELNEATAQGVRLSQQEVNQLVEIARLTEVARRSSGRVAALGDAATVTEKYTAALDELNVKLADTTINQAEFNRAVFQLNPAVKAAQDAIGELGGAMARAFINGANAADALNQSLKAIASTAASEAIRNLIKGDVVGAGISAAVAGIAAIGTMLFGEGGEEEDISQKLQEAQQQADASSQSLAGLVDQMQALNDVSTGLTGAIENARKQMEAVNKAAQAQIALAIQQGTAGLLSTAQANALVQQANQAMVTAAAAFKEFAQRTIDQAREALRGTENLSAVQQKIKDLNKQADELKAAMIALGMSAEEAARLVEEDLIVALKRLAETIEKDMRRAINEMKGEGFKNAAEDLKQQISDAMAAGVDPAVIEEFTKLSLQKIVNDFKLTGQAFIQLMAQFPQFIGQITEFSDAVKRSADELKKAAKSLEDRLFAATNKTDTLAGALAAFDKKAAEEIAAEREAGGENLVLLEQVLAAERLNIIEEFNQRAIAAEEDRVRQLNALALDIATYVNQLFAGPESALSPLARLQQAQSAFNAQLALAQGGNQQALSTITRFAEDLRQAGLAYFGSSTGYQGILAQISTALINLPPLQQTTDPVVQALIDTVTPAIQATTAAVGGTTTAVGGTTSAVNTNTSATNSQTTTQSNENAQQLAQQQAIVSLISATNNLNTTANTLQTTSNNLITSTNNLLATVTSLLNTSNSTLAAIQNLQNTANSTLSAVETNTNAINAASSSQIPILQQIQTNTANTASNTAQLLAPHPWQSGGLVTGGIPGRDSVKSILTPGEVVIREPVARNNPWLVGFNQSGQMPRMTVGAANDNIERLLSLIAQKLDINISAIVGQTVAVTREARFAARKGNVA